MQERKETFVQLSLMQERCYFNLECSKYQKLFFNRTIHEAPLRLISNIKPAIQLRSFLPFGAPALLWEPIKSKLKTPTMQGLVFRKDKNHFS